MAKTFLPANQVGSPCEIFSQVPGSDRQILRTRSIGSVTFGVVFVVMRSEAFTDPGANRLVPSCCGLLQPHPNNVVDGRRFAANFTQTRIDLPTMIEAV